MSEQMYNNTDYLIDDNDSVRFTLGKYNERPLIVFGINPSVATKEKNDNTISIVETIALNRGYDGFLMLNIYPVRATQIDESFDAACNESISNRNLELISQRIQEGTEIVAAWGSHICDRDYFTDILIKINDIVKSKKAHWVVLSLTKFGHPHHPTRLAYDKMTFDSFDVDTYISKILKV
jgi:hypothetical protein